ncbi:MAG: ABC transporter ATP-binding protein [Chitinophagaceae bacterium]|nr:ABC transporter ATP-binding protein [Chitinophagaceae bacterium]
MAALLQFRNVDIRYRSNEHGVHSIKDFFTSWKKPFQYKTILHQISFSLEEGRSLGVLGRNGSGKSTLLRAISGIIEPHQGEIICTASMAPVLALGVGLEMELTGFENMRLLLSLYGIKLTPERRDAIQQFSGLDDTTLKQPVKCYSSGMLARLSFSISFSQDCTIYIIDEVMAVGDLGFQQQCVDRIFALKQAGKSIIFVSHAPDEVARICDDAILLEQGRILSFGTAQEICKKYTELF